MGLHPHCPRSAWRVCVCPVWVLCSYGAYAWRVHVCACVMCACVVYVHLCADGCLHMHTFVCRSEECFLAHWRLSQAGWVEGRWVGMVMVVGSGLQWRSVGTVHDLREAWWDEWEGKPRLWAPWFLSTTADVRLNGWSPAGPWWRGWFQATGAASGATYWPGTPRPQSPARWRVELLPRTHTSSWTRF